MSNVILFVTGASGSGKTAALQRLSERAGWRDRCHFFDDAGVPDTDEMIARYGSGENWQKHMIGVWLEKLAATPGPVAVLEGQMKPSWIMAALEERPIYRTAILLLDCDETARTHRLTEERKQPELANADMFKWAAYLKGQADALNAQVVDTTALSLDAVADQIEHSANTLTMYSGL